MHDSKVRGSKDGRRSHRKLMVAITAGVVLSLTGAAVSPPQAAGHSGADEPSVGTQAAPASAEASASGIKAARTRQWPPTPQSVGVPAGTALSSYKGPCTITRKRTIDKKIVNCSPLNIEAIGVVIQNSKINGSVSVGTQDDYDPEGDDPIRVTILDSEIDTAAGTNLDFRPISSSHYIVKRSYLHGTYSGAECHNACTIKKSYIHGFGDHASGARILRNGTFKHNTIWCEPNPNSDEDGDGVTDEDGGCSGNLTMYEEFGTPYNNLVKHNYFPAGWFYSSLKFNGSDDGTIRIVNNRFGLPKRGGRHVADDWDPKATNVWSGNTFTNGRAAKP